LILGSKHHNNDKEADGGTYSALRLWAILPGLIYILVVDFLTVTGWLGFAQGFFQTWNIVLAVIPWVTLLVVRGSPSMFGYTRIRALVDYGWGMVAGGIWRGLSMAFNLWWQGGWTEIGWGILGWIGALVFIPLIEETFFRGYLGRGLRVRVGKWPAIFVQAILFSLHPGHWAQGYLHLVSILLFGILAGWLMERRGSIWAAWGAHGFANILPAILRFFG
jgi:membrane protease YdiL (CAAX protease family)